MLIFYNKKMTETKPHYHGHRTRLLEKFQKNPNGIADYELVELILTYVIPRRDVKPIAKELLARFNNLNTLLNTSPENIEQESPLSIRAASLFSIIAEYNKRALSEKVKSKPILQKWDDLTLYCRSTLAHKAHEEFHILFLDTKFELIEDVCMATGTIDQAIVYPREVVKKALDLHARSVILLHNHPSGRTAPSYADIELTKKIYTALSAVDIDMHDHLITGKDEVVSFKELGFWTHNW